MMLPILPPFNFFPTNHKNLHYNKYNSRPSNSNDSKINVSNFDKNVSNNQSGQNSSVGGFTRSSTCTTKDRQDSFSSEGDDCFSYFFEIFGIKLYFDDILIICILFFLYTEGVQDEELFICLILLLLT